MRWIIAMVALATLQPAQGGTCPRPAPRALGAEVVIRGAPPCQLVFRPTGIRLRTDSAGVHPHPGDKVVMDSRGRFYSNAYPANAFPGMIAAWSPTGAFLRTIGGVGQGPGALSARGGLSFFLDARDRLHVRDGDQRWSIFSSDMAFVSSASSAEIGGLPPWTAVLDNGTVLASDWFTRGRNYFHVASLEGRELSSFAPIPDTIRVATQNRPTRTIAYAGGAEFVAAPPSRFPGSYELEVWSVEGKLIRTFRREVPWFPPADLTRPRTPATPPDPTIGFLHLDSAGVLLVGAFVPGATWTPVASQASGSSQRMAVMDVWLEAIDTRSGTLLASAMMSGLAADTLLRGFIPRRNLRARIDETVKDDRFVEILRYELVPAPTGRGRKPW